MSGGSYNYLCRQIWSGDPISLNDLASMRDRLNNLTPGSAAARDTAALYAKLSAAQDNELDALAQVWHDVEWFDSSDYSEDQARAGIAKYENAQLADRAESAAPGDLAARLLAAIEETEQLARDAINPTDVPCQITVNGQPQPTTHGDHVIYGDGATALRNLIAQHPNAVLRGCAADRKIVEQQWAYAAQIDGEWGCCHTAEQIERGECAEYNPDTGHGLPLLTALAEGYGIATEETT